LKIDPARIDEFRAEFARAMADNNSSPAAGELSIAAEVRLADVTHKAIQDLEQLGPFGAENRRPLFAATEVELVGSPRKMGEGERHLSLLVRQFGTTLRGVAFGKADWADELAAAGGPVSICFEPTINAFRGEERVEFRLVDWRPARVAAAT
jgi:single-stranded-DNA-specific exonuclease